MSYVYEGYIILLKALLTNREALCSMILCHRSEIIITQWTTEARLCSQDQASSYCIRRAINACVAVVKCIHISI